MLCWVYDFSDLNVFPSLDTSLVLQLSGRGAAFNAIVDDDGAVVVVGVVFLQAKVQRIDDILSEASSKRVRYRPQVRVCDVENNGDS